MADELDLFASADPDWLKCPVSRIEKAFAAFHRVNPAVYRWLERKALALQAKGVRHFGIATLYEALRCEEMETRGDSFKLNNSYRALYSRLLIYRHPSLERCIELRERKEGVAAA
jgi:hypothetical protein